MVSKQFFFLLLSWNIVFKLWTICAHNLLLRSLEGDLGVSKVNIL
jgi:hypothetical protein